ncbi:hypothetical protein M413DRAFT_34098, partial [Hebeloma cylindrosporum]
VERLMEDWNSPIYAFFHTVPTVGYKDGRRYHEFRCFASSCSKTVHRFLDKKDAGSTSNLHKHAKLCWGPDTVKGAMGTKNATEAREVLAQSKDGSIAAAFQVKGKGKVTYSHRQYTQTETKNLMKTGRPEYYLLSSTTVSRDVHLVFVRSRQRIASLLYMSDLSKHEGKLHFATDAWTSPNHRAYVALTVHFEHNGEPVCMILDVVEVAKSHTGVNLAVAF